MGGKEGGARSGSSPKGDALMKKDRKKDFVCVCVSVHTHKYVYVFQAWRVHLQRDNHFSIFYIYGMYTICQTLCKRPLGIVKKQNTDS